jgi:hypothetical protein
MVRSDIAVLAQIMQDYLDGRVRFEGVLAANELADGGRLCGTE